MAKPTNPILVANFGENLVAKKDANHELWAVTSHILVPKGTNMEQLMADMMTGKFADDPSKLQTVATAVADVTKLG